MANEYIGKNPDFGYLNKETVDPTSGTTPSLANSTIPYTTSSNYLHQEWTNQNQSTSQATINLVLSIDQSNTVGGDDTHFGDNSSRDIVGQSFLCQSTGILDKFIFRLKKVGSPTDNIVGYLYSLSSQDPNGTGNTLLATTDTVTGSAIGTNYEEVTFQFSGSERYTIQSGVYYCVVIGRTGTVDASNYWFQDSVTPSAYSNGTAIAPLNTANGPFDRWFKTFVESSRGITLSSGTWPTNCDNGSISFDNGSTWFDIDSRDSNTELTLVSSPTAGTFDYKIRLAEVDGGVYKMNTKDSTNVISEYVSIAETYENIDPLQEVLDIDSVAATETLNSQNAYYTLVRGTDDMTEYEDVDSQFVIWATHSQTAKNITSVASAASVTSNSEQDIDNNSVATNRHFGFNDVEFGGNTFIPNTSGLLTEIKVGMASISSPTDDVFLTIFATTAGSGSNSESNNIPTGSVLATSDSVSGTTFPGNSTPTDNISFTFSGANKISLTAGVEYAWVAQRSGGVSSTDQYTITTSNASGFGNYLEKDPGSNTWETNHAAGITHCYEVYVGPITPKFGSGMLDLTSSSQQYLTTPAVSDLRLGGTNGTGEFTVESWYNSREIALSPGYTGDFTSISGASYTADNSVSASVPSRAFDDGDPDHVWVASGAFPHWVKVDLGAGNEKTATQATMMAANASQQIFLDIVLKEWKLQGSNDDTNWTDLLTRNEPTWSYTEKRTYQFSNSTAYRYYRFFITSSQGGNPNDTRVGFGEAELMESLAEGQTLLSHYEDADNWWRFVLLEDRAKFEASNGGVVKFYDPTCTINDETWHHYRVTKDSGGTLHIYQDGSELTSGTTGGASNDFSSYTMPTCSQNTVQIGKNHDGMYGHGWYDDVRVSKVDRGSTAPTAAPATDTDTDLLLHFDGNLNDSSSLTFSNWKDSVRFDGTNWQYNTDNTPADNTTVTWTNASTNDMLHAVSEAVKENPALRMTSTDMNNITDDQLNQAAASDSAGGVIIDTHKKMSWISTIHTDNNTQNPQVDLIQTNYDSTTLTFEMSGTRKINGASSILVSKNDVVQTPETEYKISGDNKIIFTPTPENSDKIYVHYLQGDFGTDGYLGTDKYVGSGIQFPAQSSNVIDYNTASEYLHQEWTNATEGTSQITVNPPGTTELSNATSPDSQSGLYGPGQNGFFSMEFRAPAGSMDLNSITTRIKNVNSSTDGLVIKIYLSLNQSSNGGDPDVNGTLLATSSTVNGNTIGSTEQEVTFDFSGFVLTPNTRYCAVLSRTSSTNNNSNFYEISTQSNSKGSDFYLRISHDGSAPNTFVNAGSTTCYLKVNYVSSPATATISSGTFNSNFANGAISFDGGTTFLNIESVNNQQITPSSYPAAGTYDYKIRLGEIDSGVFRFNQNSTNNLYALDEYTSVVKTFANMADISDVFDTDGVTAVETLNGKNAYYTMIRGDANMTSYDDADTEIVAFSLSDTEVLDTDINVSGTDLDLGSDVSNQKIYQSWTHSSSNIIKSVKVNLKAVGSPTQTITLKTYTNNNDRPGTLLHTSSTTLDASTLTSSYVEYSFPITGGTTYATGVKYVWELSIVDHTFDASNYIQVQGQLGNNYTDGDSVKRTYAGPQYRGKDTYAHVGRGTGAIHDGAYRAQTFTATSSGTMNGIEINLYKNSINSAPLPNDDLTISLYSTSGSGQSAFPNTLLATMTFDNSRLSGGTSSNNSFLPNSSSLAKEFHYVEWDTPVNITSGTIYAIVVNRIDPTVTNNDSWYDWGSGKSGDSNDPNTYTGGFRFLKHTPSDSWIADSNSGHDMYFRVFFEEAADMKSRIFDGTAIVKNWKSVARCDGGTTWQYNSDNTMGDNTTVTWTNASTNDMLHAISDAIENNSALRCDGTTLNAITDAELNQAASSSSAGGVTIGTDAKMTWATTLFTDSSSATPTVDSITTTYDQTTGYFLLSDTVTADSDITVYVNSTEQTAGVDYTIFDGNQLQLTTPPANSAVVRVDWNKGTVFAREYVNTDKIVSFDASKLTGSALPAGVQAGGITNLSDTTSSDVTYASADPTNTTNPSDGVGALFCNQVDGSLWVCTDATTDQNTWYNVGGGSEHIHSDSFQGEISGFVAGGGDSVSTINIIDKFSLTSSANAIDHGDLSQGVQGMGNASTKTHGYVAGGFTFGTPNSTDIVSKFSFNSNTTSSNIGTMQSSRYYAAGATDSTNGAGYFMGGVELSSGTTVQSIDKLTFSNDSVSNHTGSLQPARHGGSGTNSSTHGFISGGNISGQITSIDKIDFSSGTDSTDHGDLQSAGQLGAGISSTTDGYYAGGTIEKFSFASMTTAASHGNLSNSRSGGNIAGISGTTHGWTAGGSGPQNIIDRFPYASNSGATDWSDLTVARAPHGGYQY